MSVVAILFDESSVDDLQCRQQDRLKRRATVEFFVCEKSEEFWAWVHPRYR